MSTEEGIANERTALAWQRTALSLVAASAIITRLTFDDLGPPALVGMAISLSLSGWVMLESRNRYAHDARTRIRKRSRGGRAPTALALSTIVIAAMELAALWA